MHPMAKATDFISQLDVPIGYIGLDEAVPRLIAAISDHEHSVWLARISERERSFRNFLKEACEGAGPEVCKKAGIQADAPVRSPFAGIPLDKREMAICELGAALGNSTLPSLVRDPDSGELFRLTDTDWHGLGDWRTTIISGVIRASLGEHIWRYNGRRVLLEAAAFEDWLEARNPEQIGAETESATPVASQLGAEETPTVEPGAPPSTAPVVAKLVGKAWIPIAYERRREKFQKDGTSITDAARDLANESETAADCAKPLKWPYIKNVLRDGIWHEPARVRFKQQPT